METLRVDAGDVALAADFDGPPDGPGVILMHGGGQTRHAWRKAVAALVAQRYRTVAFDARGHGDSDWSPDGQYSFDISVRDLRAILKLTPPRPVLVGASMGGAVALMTAAETPDAAGALVLVDVTPRIDHEGADRILGFMTGNADGFATLQEAADTVARYLPHRPRPKSNEGLMKNLRRRADGRLYWHWDPRLTGTRRQDREAIATMMEDMARKVTIPTLLVRGAESELVGPEHARSFQSLVPGSEWIDVTGARHMVAGDSNDLFSAAILDFLRRAAPVPGVA